MTDSIQSLSHQIASADDLHGIVRSMKALALSNIALFEQAVQALNEYAHVIETGLGACFRDIGPINPLFEQRITTRQKGMTAIVFGSDHGLVGQFNDIIAEYATRQITAHDGMNKIYAVGERIGNRLVDLGVEISGIYPVPHSVTAITPLIGKILHAQETTGGSENANELHVYFNRPDFGTDYNPVSQQVLPFNNQLRNQWMSIDWPSQNLPQVMGQGTMTASALIREFLFVVIYRACALSLASENASRLAAMQRADQNIDELLVQLRGRYHHLRQRTIDEDLFDIVSGYEAQMKRT